MLTTLADVLRRYLADRYPGSTLSDVQFLTSGSESDIYTFTLEFSTDAPKNFILRPYHGDGAAQKLRREIAGFRHLHQASYPIPGILVSETDPAVLGRPFTIMEKLEGRALWQILSETAPSQAGQLLDRFGGLLARLHQLDWRPFIERAELYEANPTALLDELFVSFRQLYIQCDVVGFLSVVDWLEQHQSDIMVYPAVVHLDFHANNVLLCQDDRLVVIDWTQVAVSDFRADLSWTLMIMGDYGRRQWGERILQAYCAAAKHPVTHLDYFNVITDMKLLASTVISLRQGPEKLGLRAEAIDSLEQQVPLLRRLSGRIQSLTGISIPEVALLLSDI
jgi:aminoglycoside phosphotransferase (APT) family kinase protein